MEINILKIYYFQMRAPRAKGQVSGHPGHPLDPPLQMSHFKAKMHQILFLTSVCLSLRWSWTLTQPCRAHSLYKRKTRRHKTIVHTTVAQTTLPHIQSE